MVKPADLGRTITVTVTGKKAGYATQSGVSAGRVVTLPLQAGSPKILGSLTVGSTLTADAGVWGPAPVDIAYMWQRNGLPIPGETQQTYVVKPEDALQDIRLKVFVSKPGYTTTPGWSDSARVAGVSDAALRGDAGEDRGSVDVVP
ncbi:hypothetical protein G7067_04725 [Leucobacter insecticola]|uniref:Uncharacterized protein n=1 Tax=Leucobacter insecticola TaxID=2714934 RepID=A0A6G8FHW8_9MICO|nr:hypothetical protein [Leucobacter insecticola]QIM15879.1 hypothetical protein G7067_04725 [Leucobacter insecticola]